MQRQKGTKDEVLRIRLDKELKKSLFDYADAKNVKVSAVVRESILQMVGQSRPS